MINKISLQNFKSFSELVEVNLSELLVIAGPNSTGKTSLIQALLLLSQTLNNPRQDVVLDLSGSEIQFAQFRDIVFGRPQNIEAKFTICFNLSVKEGNPRLFLIPEMLSQPNVMSNITSLGIAKKLKNEIPEESQTERNAKFQITFGAARLGKPIIHSLIFEKQINEQLLIRHELEKVGKKYRTTVNYISSDKATPSEITQLLDRLNSQLEGLKGTVARAISSTTSSRIKVSLRSYLRLLYQFYGFDLNWLPEPLKSIEQSLERIRVPLAKYWSEELSEEMGQLIDGIVNLASRLESENIAVLPISFDHFFPSNSSPYLSGLDLKLDEYISGFIAVFSTTVREIRRYLKSIEYVGPLRAKPERVYLPIGTPLDVGKSGENAIPILWLEQSEKVMTTTKPGRAAVKKRLDKAVQEWFEEFGIARAFHVTKPKRVIYQAELDGPRGSGTKVIIADVGFGVSQLLPVIVAGLRAHEKTTLIFEQPEIHLHPRLQAKLADFFICLVELNKQVIIETHSEHLINMLRLRVIEDKTGELQNKLRIVFVQAHSEENQKGKGSYVSNLKLDDYGQIINWPYDFFPEYGDLNEKILLAMMTKHSGD